MQVSLYFADGQKGNRLFLFQMPERKIDIHGDPFRGIQPDQGDPAEYRPEGGDKLGPVQRGMFMDEREASKTEREETREERKETLKIVQQLSDNVKDMNHEMKIIQEKIK